MLRENYLYVNHTNRVIVLTDHNVIGLDPTLDRVDTPGSVSYGN
jgi:hypothetical protein